MNSYLCDGNPIFSYPSDDPLVKGFVNNIVIRGCMGGRASYVQGDSRREDEWYFEGHLDEEHLTFFAFIRKFIAIWYVLVYSIQLTREGYVLEERKTLMSKVDRYHRAILK